MKKYVFSILTELGSSVEIIEASNVEEALQELKKDFKGFEIHSIYSEDIE